MASMRMVEQLEEQPPAKKPRIDNPEEQGEIDANSNESNLAKSTEQKDEESKTAATIMDLPIRRLLPLEMNCEIFKCLKWPIQAKFIWGLGRGIYGMFGQKLLIKTKRVCNPKEGNRWNPNGVHRDIAISTSGLGIKGKPGALKNIYAVQGFPISGPDCRADNFPGTICYYYELKLTSSPFRGLRVGFSDGAVPDVQFSFAAHFHSYCIACHWDSASLAGERQYIYFHYPEGVTWRGKGDVYGCGLLVDPKDKLAIFLTLNGQLVGVRQIPITSSVDRLFPTVSMCGMSLNSNFGDNPGKQPFLYDIKKCSGLDLE